MLTADEKQLLDHEPFKKIAVELYQLRAWDENKVVSVLKILDKHDVSSDKLLAGMSLVELPSELTDGVRRAIKRAHPTPNSAASPNADLTESLQAVTLAAQRLTAIAERLEAGSMPDTDFSKVSESTATSVLAFLNLLEVDGDKMDPLKEPDNYLEPFDMAEYPDEDKATAPCLTHIQSSLTDFGVCFDGRNGFEMHDMHLKNKIYTTVASGRKYSGGIDGAIAPFGVVVSAASSAVVRVAIELKHSKADKQRYDAAHPDASQQVAALPPARPLTYSGTIKGQALMELLAANAYSQHPVHMLLCGGKEFNVLLHIRGEQLWVWKVASWGAIIMRLSTVLQSCSADMGFKSIDENGTKVPGCTLSEEQLRPLKKCRGLLPPKGAMLEALESIMPFAESDVERHELIAQLLHCAYAGDYPPLPSNIQHMYA